MKQLTDTAASTRSTGTTKAVCEQCGRTFRNAWGLQIHRSRIHEGRKRSSRRPANPPAAVPKASRNHAFSAHFCPNCGCPLTGIGPGIAAALQIGNGAS